MKEMCYKTEMLKKPELLAKGTCKGIDWYVFSYGTHPCCYIGLPKGHPLYGKDYEDVCIDCHGGLTYSGYLEHSLDTDKWIFGWDYGHYLDQIGTFMDGHQWTTIELIEEAKGVIYENRLEVK